MKLDIGSGRKHFEDYVTLDKDPKVGADLCLDIEDFTPSPQFIDEFGIGGIDEIRAFHILEHIRPENKVKVIKTFYELLKIGGILHIEVPIATTVQFWQDPTHLSGWTPETFWYFTKGNRFGEAFAKRHSDARLFEKIEDEIRDGWAYRIKLKKI